MIKRFDRVIVNGVAYRLHQEDFARALGLPAGLKYERRGVPGRRFDTQAIGCLLNRLSSPAQARETLVRATLFNLAIGNTAHFFDDLIGRELGHLAYLLGLEMEIGDRDYIELGAAGGWLPDS